MRLQHILSKDDDSGNGAFGEITGGNGIGSGMGLLNTSAYGKAGGAGDGSGSRGDETDNGCGGLTEEIAYASPMPSTYVLKNDFT